MEEEPIESIRETSRNLLVLNRRKHRDEVADVRRSIIISRKINIMHRASMVIELRVPTYLHPAFTNQSDLLHNLLNGKMFSKTNSDMVTLIARKLKSKSAITAPELHTLKNALIDDAVNIELVLHTSGALRGLVREMTGHDVNKQCAAIGCFCNLALGDVKACVLISKSAGPYLIPALDSLSAELAVTSAWTLGNLAGSGQKPCELLTSQGAISKLIDLLISNNEETRDSVLYALVHFTHQLQDDLKPEYLHKILQVLPTLRIASSSHLFFILSCHSNFSNRFLSEEFILKSLRYLSVSIEKSLENPNIVYLFRFLANLDSQEVFRIFLNYFATNNKVDVLKKLLETDYVKDTVLWFLGNAYKCCNTHELFDMLIT